MMYQNAEFLLMQAIAFCIAGLLAYFVDKKNSKKHIKETEE